MGILNTLTGGVLQNYYNKKAASKNAAMQKEFAQQGIRWKVEDAKSAGINPLVALGAPSFSPAPVHTAPDIGDLGLDKLGQDISRAMGSKMTREEQEMLDLKKRLLEVQIDGQEIKNNNSRNTGTGVPLPSAESNGEFNQIHGNATKQIPSEVIAGIKDRPGVVAGKHAKYQYNIDEEGGLTIEPSEKYAEVMESHLPAWIRENIKNSTLAIKSVIYGNKKIGTSLEKYIRKIRPKHQNKNYEYRWDTKSQKFRPVKIKNGETQVFYQKPSWKKHIKTFKVR